MKGPPAVPPKTPPMSRAARRLAKKPSKSGAFGFDDLRARIEKARLKGPGRPLETRIKRVLLSYVETGQTHGLSLKEVVADMASGQAAWRLGGALRDEILRQPPQAVQDAACREGCAFCCILSGDNGAVITRTEAEAVHAALTPLKGTADGRNWHPAACPSLDPETRACRIYEARPMICRSFLSTDVAACEANAEGASDVGPGLLGSHLDYLLVLALCRQALVGIAPVASYSLAAIAAQALEGAPLDDALESARHKPKVLDEAAQDAARAAGAA